MKRKKQFLATVTIGQAVLATCALFVMVAVSQAQDSGVQGFSGRYNSWFRFGGGSITLQSDGAFLSEHGSCTFSTEESGTYSVSEEKLHFKISKYTGKQNRDGQEVDLFDSKARREFFRYGEDVKDVPPEREFVLYPVKWGERTYLIYENDLDDFTNAINLTIEPRDEGPQPNYYGMFYLREGDETRKASGKPGLPTEYQELLLADPITATIISIDPKPDARQEGERIATIDKGRLAGVRKGMKFIAPEQDPTFWSNDGVVLSVEDTSAKVEVFHRLVGEVLTTKYVRKDPFQ